MVRLLSAAASMGTPLAPIFTGRVQAVSWGWSVVSMRLSAQIVWLMLVTMATGCALSPRLPDRSLKTLAGTPTRELERGYQIHAPDVLTINFDGLDDLDGSYAVAADGQITLGNGLHLRVDGMPIAEIGRILADKLDQQPDQVHVRVAEHRSQVIFVDGEIEGQARAVPYIGPETLPSFLKRTGGLTESAAPEQVEVRRSNAAEGRSPETIKSDLSEFIKHPEAARQIRLMPFDHVSVGTSRQSILRRCLPPWLSKPWLSATKPKPTATPADDPPSP